MLSVRRYPCQVSLTIRLTKRYYVHHTYKPQSRIYQSGILFQQKRLKYSPEPQTDRTCKTGNQDNQKYLTN